MQDVRQTLECTGDIHRTTSDKGPAVIRSRMLEPMTEQHNVADGLWPSEVHTNESGGPETMPKYHLGNCHVGGGFRAARVPVSRMFQRTTPPATSPAFTRT